MGKLRPLLVTVLSGALALPVGAATAQAQEAEEEGAVEAGDEADDGSSESEAADDAPSPAATPGAGATTAEGGESMPQVSETHAVQSGDTLWDLCGKYLNSPWYWPKIWSYNPQITNPHWIYPGNELRFYPSDENLPTAVDVSRPLATEDQSGDEDVDIVRTVGSINVGRTAPNSVFTAYLGFVSASAQESAGQIVNSEDEGTMLSDYDRTYMKFKSQPKKGDNFAVYRTVREIVHPVSGEAVGYAVEVLGGATIVDTGEGMTTGAISQAYRPIERGDYVGPWPERFGARVEPTANEKAVKGYIIETVEDVISEIGEHQLVFIDRGSQDGVRRGNTFVVVARGDGLTYETESLPNEDVGQLMVLDAQERSSTAIVTFSMRELGVGDKIEMRP